MNQTQKSGGLSVGEAIVQLLAEYGVEVVFGIPGTHSIELYRGLAGDGAAKIRHISPRHEQGGGFMADGYARTGGKPGVCFVITGPGVTNLATPLGEAFADAVPMLVISPVNAPAAGGDNLGRLHEITDQAALTAPLTALSATVAAPDDIPKLIARAFAIFASARPAPVHINIPLGVFSMRVAERWQAVAPPARPIGAREKLDAVASLLQHAKTPVMVVGGGACDCADEVLRLATTVACPLLTTVAGRGIIAGDHALSVGAQLRASGAQQLLAASDFGVFIGTELAEPDHWNDDLKLPSQQVWINLDDALLKRKSGATTINGDAGDAVQYLIQKIKPASKTKFAAAKKRCDDARKKIKTQYTRKEKIHLNVINELLKHLPANAIITSDMTQLAYTAIDFVPLTQPKKWHHPCTYGTLGYALPAAIGALIASENNTPALAIVGDAGFQYTMQEMTLAAELNLNLTALLWNNNALQQIADDMTAAGFQPTATTQQNPDFIALAKACNWNAREVTLASLGEELKKSYSESKPVLLQLNEHSITTSPPA